MLLLSSGRTQRRHVDDLEFETVRVVEEHRVIPGDVRVLLRFALELDVVGAQPVRTLVHIRARRRLEGEVMQPHPVTVKWSVSGLSLPQTDGRPRAADVPDRLAAL